MGIVVHSDFATSRRFTSSVPSAARVGRQPECRPLDATGKPVSSSRTRAAVRPSSASRQVTSRMSTGRPSSVCVWQVSNDEVNLLRPGGNYGWDPSRGGSVAGCDESVPMTDRQRFPAAVDAKWQSGSTTQAVCAAVFLSGPQWGSLDGALVITASKGAKLLVLTLDRAGSVTSVSIPPAFNETYGRLRAARLGPDGALYVTTTNGDDDRLLRVSAA